MSVAAVLPALSLEACPRIAPVPQSKLTTERHGGEDQQMVVVYRQDNDGCGDTWCQVWATDGNYSLEIVDEAPPTSMSFDDVLRPSATVVFGRGEASIHDDAERVLDSIANWMKQVARNLTDMWDGFLLGKRYLIHDRDPLFTEAVRGLLRDSGVKPLRLPANSPNLNAYAERFVLSIRRECLDRFVPLSERHLRTAVTEYVVHYHTERNHQGLGNELLTPLPASANDAGPIVSRERLGGILNYYCRAA